MNQLCDDIVPIVVTYNPDEATLIASLRALLCQAQTIVIVDNGSANGVAAALHPLEEEKPGALKYQGLQHNAGLGIAYNAGIAIARELRAVFVLLMDQDSIAEPGMLHALRQAHIHLTSQGKRIAATGACYRSDATGQLASFTRLTASGLAKIHCDGQTRFIRTDFLISSGSLIPVDALNQVGNMDETLFIDHIDTEWCFRAQSKGFEMYGVCSAIMRHSLGERRIRFWWGRWRTIAFHHPFRYYYMFRNSVLLWRRSYMPAAWKRADKLRIFSAFFFFTLFSPNRFANLQMMLKGLRDGFKGRTGKL